MSILCYIGTIAVYAIEIDGYGTSISPYIIKNEQQLLAISKDLPLTAHYKLNNDIKLITKSWIPIGANPAGTFTGVFDGNGHKITNLNIGGTTNRYDNIGLFAVNNGTISNLTVEAGEIIGNSKNIGIIAGDGTGTISNCVTSGKITGSFSSSVGSIAGTGKTISNCQSTCDINVTLNGTLEYSTSSDASAIGGIVGRSSEGAVSNCNFKGTIEVPEVNFCGGIIGNIHKGTITNCENSSTINTKSYFLGGIAGVAGYSNISGCRNKSDISSSFKFKSPLTSYAAVQMGGLIGNSVYNSVKNCYNEGAISLTATNSMAGGLIGNNSGDIKNCYNTGNVTNMSDRGAYTGGLIGNNVGNVEICYSKGDIIQTASPLRYWPNAASNYRYPGYAGGLIGCNGSSGVDYNSVKNCYSKGNISSTVKYYSGTYDTCVGSLIGFNYSQIENSFAIGDIKSEPATSDHSLGDEYLGGLIGKNNSKNKYIKNCYCIARISPLNTKTKQHIDAFSVTDSLNYENCFYNKSIDVYESTVAYGLTDDEMKDSSSCAENFTFWDFDTIWKMDSSVNNGYPHLMSTIQTITGIEISETSATLVIGAAKKLTATVLPQTVINKDITWTSSNENVATVDNTGNVTAKEIGSAIITASVSEGKYSAQCIVTVISENDNNDETTILKIDSTSAAAGEKISVPIKITQNTAGISSINIDIKYDNTIFTPVAVNTENCVIFDNIDADINYSSDTIKISASNTANKTDIGTVCYLEFQVAENSSSNSYDLGIKVNEFKTLEGNIQKDLTPIIYNGNITVGNKNNSSENYKYGDVDGDTFITARDAALVLQKTLDGNFKFPIEN